MIASTRNFIFLIICLAFVSACSATGVMTHEDVHKALKQGMTTKDVISFFEENGIGYSFTSREEDKAYVPQFPWKDPDAIGYYGGIIPDVKTHWLHLASEHIAIQAEVNSQGIVTQVIVERAFTAP